MYAYPPSPSSDDDASPVRVPPLSQRLRALQHEVASLEAELSDPSNPLLHGDGGEAVDPGVLMKGLVDVRGRLDKVSRTKDGRGRLVERVVRATEGPSSSVAIPDEKKGAESPEVHDISEIHRRIGELENIVGSSGTTLDEVRLDSGIIAPPKLIRSPVIAATTSPSTAYHTTKQSANIAHATAAH